VLYSYVPCVYMFVYVDYMLKYVLCISSVIKLLIQKLMLCGNTPYIHTVPYKYKMQSIGVRSSQFQVGYQ
jgi:hypothetical protein